jgi:hypothetical protein
MEQVAPAVFSNIFQMLNNSKLFSAFVMVIMNMGSKYISIDMCDFHEKILSSFIFRKIAVFAIFWTATRDIILSLILTLIFSFVVSGLFNDKSRLCIIPKKSIFMQQKQKTITPQEVAAAQHTLKMYSDQNNPENKNKPDFEEMFENVEKRKKDTYKFNKFILKKYSAYKK